MTFRDPQWYQMAAETVSIIFREDLGREPDWSGWGTYMELQVEHGWTAEQIRAAVRNSDEYKQLHAPKPASIAPIAPREFKGQMCGIHVPGLPSVPGGAPDPSLVLSWFYPRYAPEWRAKIRAEWKRLGYLDVVTSWWDDAQHGLNLDQIVAMRQELCADGLRPCEMLTAKTMGVKDNGVAAVSKALAALNAFINEDCISRYCVGWELNLFNTYESLQHQIDEFARFIGSKRPLYVHFSPGYADWRPNRPGSTFADFWNAQQGKLTGLLHQRDQKWSNAEYRGRLTDILERFSGGFGVVSDSGFGHPFDLIELEICADDRYNGRISEAKNLELVKFALETPAVKGVRVMGSGNG